MLIFREGDFNDLSLSENSNQKKTIIPAVPLTLILGFILIEFFHEGNSNLGWAIAGGIGNVSQVPLFWIITGKIWLIHWSLFVMACMFGFISGVFLAGLLGKLISKRIKNSGII